MNTLTGKYPEIEWNYIENGNMEDLNPEMVSSIFREKMNTITPFVSCAYKHLLALKELQKSNKQWALVVEDDIDFYPDFDLKLQHILAEAEQEKVDNSMVSLEDSIPRYVPRSERQEGKMLYAKDEMRLAGAYLVDRKAADTILAYIDLNKCHLTIDWFYTFLMKEKTINGWWSHPALACQKSLSGGMPSLIDKKSTGWFRRLNFSIQKWIKRLRSNLN